MEFRFGTRPFPSRCGFSQAEVLVAIVVLAVLAGVGVVLISRSKVTEVDTKFRTDAVRLNQIVSLDLADGRSPEGLTSTIAKFVSNHSPTLLSAE